ncbi:hypothetical protein PPTG_22027 [Phytophthora nicotianae INRA-310]|uniref:Uncharacterized protein n=1 Tax=Phytophthora nicotianae (strain INRA-310) TaxID=761204 RepID=W2QNW7_PHYN3|nr:hypothetical protein PPTG_22027 [Phytophthora nicotianae INRA-310]ETN14872.1 hypothetical protein PPTG_22027 [Phytophthora nicotianae INRA-310]
MPRTTGAHDIKPETRVAVAIFLTTLSKEGRLCYGTISAHDLCVKQSHTDFDFYKC